VLEAFVQSTNGSATPLLLSSRPTKTFRPLVEGTSRWAVAEPCRLDETTLDTFVKHYGGADLPESLKSPCRVRDDEYLPILVRMAMTLQDDGGAAAGVADLYRCYFLRTFEALLPGEAERFGLLAEAARWCLETYWLTGARKIDYTGKPLQRQLRDAGILVPADGLEPPSQVQFFHDSMQSYLTAYGLAAEDQGGYAKLPGPPDAASVAAWDRGTVLLRVAADRSFTGARSDLLETGGTELYQMCLTTFRPQAGLRRWLRSELVRRAEAHDEDLRRKDILGAIPMHVLPLVEKTRGCAKLLEKAADACYASDEQTDTVDLLGRLYAAVAPLVYDLAVETSQAA
jgi:hypothetical protein